MMSPRQIGLLWAALVVVMLACRCLPLLALGGRRLHPVAEQAISLIPIAAFSALVANDLVQPDLLAESPQQVAVTLLSASAVVVVARKTGSLVWCALAGMGIYGLLGMVLA